MTTPHVHVVCDKLIATQEISFGAALQGAVRTSFADLGRGRETPERLLPQERPDVLVLSRLTAPPLPGLVAWARERGVPVIYHIDDDLLGVPDTLGAARAAHYGDAERLDRLRRALDDVDLVYASTPALAAQLRSYGVAAPVREGRLYCSAGADELSTPLPSTLPTLGYMGSGSHAADLAAVLPAIERVMEARPLLQFEVMGSLKVPEALGRFAGRVRHHAPTSDYRAFRRRLGQLGWWVALAPLQDTPFNACKADTKWVEYAAAGIATVAQDHPVYRPACAGGAGRLAGNDPAQWEAACTALLDDRSARREAVERARARLRAEYGHSRLRAQVLGMLAAAREEAGSRRRVIA
jgi:hypothetical protein